MATYRVYINILGNASKALNGMLRDVAGLNKGIEGTISKFGALGKAAGAAFKAVSSGVVGYAKLNATFYALGPKALASAGNFLAGPQAEAGIALLQRRAQAERGFGKEYARTQRQADLLAASYGLNPTDVIASLNVLTGMRVGNKRLQLGHAMSLVQAGGLIAQQGGVSYENVMLNLQQLMAQDQLNSRDIKQLLTHAPILGRYAIDEMEKKGITGQTAQEYFKGDKGALLSVLERYLNEMPAILSTRARGIAHQAQLGLYASVLENPAWLKIADKYAQMIEGLGKAMNKALTGLTESETIQTSVNAFISLLDRLASSETVIEKLGKYFDSFVKEAYKVAGYAPGDVKGAGIAMTEQEKAVEKMIAQNVGTARLMLAKAGFVVPKSDAEVVSYVSSLIGLRGGANKYVETYLPYALSSAATPEALKQAYPEDFGYSVRAKNKMAFRAAQAMRYGSSVPYFTPSEAPTQTGYMGFAPISQKVWDAIQKAGVATAGLEGFGGSQGGADGSSMAGYGRDRKALTINFNAPIVEWDSTINTDDPNEVVQEVSASIEGAASRAIQIALLGATGKMNTRW